VPTNFDKDTPLTDFDWDEFHPTSPYDVYVPQSPPRKRWSIVLGIVLYLTGQVSAPFLFPRLLIGAGVISSREALEAARSVINAATFWLLDVSNGISVALILAAVLGFYREKLASLGFTSTKVPKALLYGVLGFVVAFAVSGVVGYPIQQRFGADPTQEALSQATEAPGLFPLVIVSGVIIAPVAEEIVFRGYFYKAFRDRFKPSHAIVLSAALFAVLHLELLATVQLFVIGIALAYVYEKTGNLMAPITLHVLNNAVAFLVFR
jgi:membrane protease YdiL (CAAX protease family)